KEETVLEIAPVGQYPIVQEPITLKVFTTRDTPSNNFDIKTNGFVKQLEELTNVKIEWDIATGDGSQQTQKLNLKLASGDYPDVFLRTPMSRAQLQLYGQQGLLLPLNDYIENNTTNLKAVFEELDYLKDALTAPDGNIYGLPSINLAYHVMYPNKLWLNQTWLEKLNLSEPKTTEEFYQVLKAFKEQDPNGNGKADEIPLAAAGSEGNTGLFMNLMNSFVYYDGTFTQLVDGKIEFIADDEAFREGLRYIAKLYKEGLIAQNVFTMDRTQTTAIGMSEEPILGAAPAMWIGQFVQGSLANEAGSRFWDYQLAMEPLEGPNGVKQTAAPKPDMVGNAFSITSSCKTPEVAMQMIDYLYSMEGSLNGHYGPERETKEELDKEGYGWRRAVEGEVGADGQKAIWDNKGFLGDSNSGLYDRIFPLYQPTKLHTGSVVADPSLSNEKLLWEVTDSKMVPYAVDKSVPKLFMSDEVSSVLAEQETTIKAAVVEAMAQFVTGVRDIEKDWDKYVKDLQGLGLEEYIKVYQEQYDLNAK
ncbi:MAG: extracellular solute-binding protein, partial [Niameybacter sp.]